MTRRMAAWSYAVSRHPGEETISILYQHQRALMASRFESLSLGELGTVSHAFELMTKAVMQFDTGEGVGEATKAM